MNKDKLTYVALVVLAILALVGWMLAVAVKPVAIGGSQALRERIAIDAREDSYIWNGADLKFYSDDHATQTFAIDGATGALTVKAVTSSGNITTTGTLGSIGNITTNGDVSARAITGTGQLSIGAITSSGNVTTTGTLGSIGNVTTNGDVSARVLTTTAQASVGSLLINSVAQTGAVKVISGSVANNGVIAHGLAAAPTYAVCGPFRAGSLGGVPFTYTVSVSSTDTTNVVIGIGDANYSTPAGGTYVINCMVVP